MHIVGQLIFRLPKWMLGFSMPDMWLSFSTKVVISKCSLGWGKKFRFTSFLFSED